MINLLPDTNLLVYEEINHQEEIIRNVLFLDDRSKRFRAAIQRYRFDYLTITCTVQETIELLQTEEWDIVSLDHDLNYEHYVDSDRKDCGMEIVRWLEEHHQEISHLDGAEFIIHSSNHEASDEMVNRLLNIGLQARRESVYE